MNFKMLENLMDHLTSWRIPGNSIIVNIAGEDVFSYSSGYASIEEKIPMDPHKIINIYSSSKMLTCAAALQLFEKGEFKLDDPLYDFIPEYGEMYLKNGEKAKNHITLRHLFTMSAGFNYDRNAPAFEKSRVITEGRMETLAVIRNLANDPLEFEPGEHYQYSFCHDVLAAVVEVVSGKKYRDYIQENIYNPLEMKESYFHNDHVRDKMAEQYCYEDGETQNEGKIVNVGKEVGLIFGPEYDSGGAGVVTTVADYSKFTTALANWGTAPNGERILNKETVELMRTSHFNSEHHFKYHPNKALIGYGYGLGVRVMEDLKLASSSGRLREFGWNGAAGAIAIIDPEINLSVFYSHHMINCQEDYCAPKIRNTVYDCLRR